MSYLSVFRTFWKSFSFFSNINEVLSGEQERESIIRMKVGLKNPSIAITILHHSASLVMPIGDRRDGFFNPFLTLILDSYILTQTNE